MNPEAIAVLESLKAYFRKDIPSGSEVFSEALHSVIGNRVTDQTWVKNNFSELVEQIQLCAYAIYLKHESTVGGLAIESAFIQTLPENPTVDSVFDSFSRNFWALDKFFLSLTNGRRPRAGSAFEHVIKTLFNSLNYPYTSQPVINGKPDFLLPSRDHYLNNAMDCIIFTVKRSLRERWRQITTEGTQGHMFFLATIDENVSVNDLQEMQRSRIYLVMPIEIKKAFYLNITNVISFETFFEQHLDPAMNRWRANGVI